MRIKKPFLSSTFTSLAYFFIHSFIHSYTLSLAYRKVNIRWRAFNFICSCYFIQLFQMVCYKISHVLFDVLYWNQINQLLWHYLHLKHMQFMYTFHISFTQVNSFFIPSCSIELTVDTLFADHLKQWINFSCKQFIKATYATICTTRTNIRWHFDFFLSLSVLLFKCKTL